jgi:hypothetical protein
MPHPIWSHWTLISGEGKSARVYCKYCKSHEQSKHSIKCKTHTIRCKKAPVSVRNQFSHELNAKRHTKKSFITDFKDDESQQYEELPLISMEPSDEEEVTANHFYNSSKISNPKRYSRKRKKSESSFDGVCGNDIEEYIDTFHRIKKDIKYMLNNTISERKREFLRSYSFNFFINFHFFPSIF